MHEHKHFHNCNIKKLANEKPLTIATIYAIRPVAKTTHTRAHANSTSNYNNISMPVNRVIIVHNMTR